MSDATALRLLADEVVAIAGVVPGVERVQARPGVGRFARRVLSSLAAGADAPGQPDVVIQVGATVTSVDLDIVVGLEFAAPEVARAVASNVRARLSLEELPPASVDVRVVSII